MAKKTLTKKDKENFIKRLEAVRKDLAASRDELGSIKSEVEDIYDVNQESLELISAAIERLSELV